MSTSSDGAPWERPGWWLVKLLAVGLVVQVVSFVVAFMNVPRTELGPGLPVTRGEPVLLALGLLGFGLGGVLSLVAVVGLGVWLGLRAHDRARSTR